METEIAEKVLQIAGFAEMTAANSKLFRKRVCGALNGHAVVEVDLSQTMFMDCSGFGALTDICNLVRGQRIRVRVVNSTSQVQQLLHIMHAEQVLEIVRRPPMPAPIIALIEVTPQKIQTSPLSALAANMLVIRQSSELFHHRGKNI